jgi:S-layer protein
LAAGSLTANGIETINITSTNSVTASLPATRLDTLTLAADAVKTIVISGAAGLNLTNTDTTVTSVDASGITGTTTQPNAFTWTAGALTNTANAATIIGTAAGANTISLNSVTDSLLASTITVGGSANVSANVITGGAGPDTVTGGAGNDSFVMQGGRDTITTGSGNDKITLGTAAVDRDTVTDFTAGVASGATDKLILSTIDASVRSYATVTAASAAYSVALTDDTDGSVIEFAFAANTAKSLGDGSADSLTGVNLMKALGDGETAATLTLSGSSVTDADMAYIVAYQGGNAYIYLFGTSDGTTNTVVGTELALVGILNNVAVGALTTDNFGTS